MVYGQHNSPEHFQEYFDDTIEKLSASGEKIIFMGDTNLNLLRFHSCKYAQNFILSLQSFNLMPTIDKPTRVHNNSYSLIDNIFISNLKDYITSGNVISDLTDYFSQFCFLHSDKTIFKHNCHKILARDYSRYSETEFLHDLSQFDLIQAVSKNIDENKSFSAFYNKLNNLLNKHAPLKSVSKRMFKPLSKPWITKAIRKSIKIKNQLFTSGDTDAYKTYRNRIGVKIWNSLPCEVRQISKSNFKNNVNDILFQRLLKYDDYIDVWIILANFDSSV